MKNESFLNETRFCEHKFDNFQ